MAHLQRQNDPLVKGGWKSIQVRHPESIQYRDTPWAVTVSETQANRIEIRRVLDRSIVERMHHRTRSTLEAMNPKGSRNEMQVSPSLYVR